MIEVSVLINKRLKKSDPRLAWMILQNMYLMNGDVNNKEERHYAMLLTSMSENVQANKQNYTF